MPRYLFGPVPAPFADENLGGPRRAGDCLAFNADGTADLTVTPADTWDQVLARLPPGWRPDWVALYLPYTDIPECLWTAPAPLVGLAADANFLWSHYLRVLPRCERVLADAPSAERLQRAGVTHARPAVLFGLGRGFLEGPGPGGPRDIDVLFAGNFHPAVQRERLPWLARLAGLHPRRRVELHAGVFGEDYRRLLGRARVAFNRAVRGECNQRAFEAAAAGALLFQEADNREVPHLFQEGREYVAYTAENLESLLEHYLEDEDARRAVAEAARARAASYTFERLWGGQVALLERDLTALQEAAARRPRPAAARPGLLDEVIRVVDVAPAGQGGEAPGRARRLLALLDSASPPDLLAHAAPHPPGFDAFRVEWERAGWDHAGDPGGEARAKRALLRWRLHHLAAGLTGDPAHAYEAALARPDLPESRAELGAALLGAGRPVDAAPHLRAAVAANPFHAGAARQLHRALAASGDEGGARRLARARRHLSACAPALVPAEPWFTGAAPVGDELASVIVLCCNEAAYTRLCLESVLRHTRPPYELILVDNGSADETAAYLEGVRARPGPARVTVLRNAANRGYPAGCNQGLAEARGDYLVFLNNDAVVTPGWLDGLVAWALHDWPRTGLAGAVTNYAAPPQQVDAPYRDLSGLDAFAAQRRREYAGKALQVERLTGFCLLARRAVLERIGGFDERFGLGFFDDDDLCLRARRAGFGLLAALDVYVHHFGSRTFAGLGVDAARQLAGNLALYRDKWGPEEAGRYRAADAAAPAPAPAAPPGPARVSLCLIARDEEANLAACLESARGLADEVVVVDTGSADRTREVATRHGARVFDFPWCDDFAAARNASLGHATGDWIFWLDADDRLDGANREKLRDLFRGLGRENAAYVMDCLCLPDAEGVATVVSHVRLFPNRPDLRWAYRVHEQIQPALRAAGARTHFTDVTIHHTGYVDPALRRAKAARDLRLLRLDEAERPGDPFTLFNLGAHHHAEGDFARALGYLGRSLERSHPSDSITRKLFALIAGSQRGLGRPEEALAACREGLGFYPGDAELLSLEGLLRYEAGDAAGAEACWRRLLGGREGAHFRSVDGGLRGYRARHQLAVLYRGQGRPAEAEAEWRAAVGENARFVPGWLGLAELYHESGRRQELASCLAALREAPGGAALAEELARHAAPTGEALPGHQAPPAEGG